MRILLDECVDPRVKRLLPKHDIVTVHQRGWDRLKDAQLLEVAQAEFDVMITIDGGIEFQQNVARLRLGIVVVHVPKNQVHYYQNVVEDLTDAVAQVRQGQVIHVRPSIP